MSEPQKPTAAAPLAGVRVLDLSIALTGPYVAALMADQGAEVVKTHTEEFGTFQSPNWGPLGIVDKGEVLFYRESRRKPMLAPPELRRPRRKMPSRGLRWRVLTEAIRSGAGTARGRGW